MRDTFEWPAGRLAGCFQRRPANCLGRASEREQHSTQIKGKKIKKPSPEIIIILWRKGLARIKILADRFFRANTTLGVAAAAAAMVLRISVEVCIGEFTKFILQDLRANAPSRRRAP
jgi:hypothetical protein